MNFIDRAAYRSTLRLAALAVSASISACGGGGGGSGAALSLSLSPSSVSQQITAGTTYTFVETATVQGSVSGTVFVLIADPSGVIQPDVPIEGSGNTFKATITTASNLAAGDHKGAFNIRLCQDQACSHEYSATSLPYDFNVVNPAPVFKGISARSATTGCPAFTLTVVGTGFVPATTVMWNGTPRSTTIVSTKLLTAQINAQDIAGAGTAAITVSTPAPGGGSTSPIQFAVTSGSLASDDAVAFQITPGHAGATNFPCPLSFPVASTWSVDLGGEVSYPLIVGNKIFATAVTQDGGRLYALDSATGSALWTSDPLNPGIGGVYEAPAYDAGRVFIADTYDYLQAFDSSTGSPLWKVDLSTDPSGVQPLSAPVATNGLLYDYVSGPSAGQAAGPGYIRAYDETTGAQKWSQQVAGGEGILPAVTANGVYISYPCNTYDFSPATGTVVWSNQGDTSHCTTLGGGASVVADDLLFSTDAPSGYSGHAFVASSGALAGTYAADYPPVYDGRLAYLVQGGVLTAVDPRINQIAWSFRQDFLQSSPIVVNQVLFIGTSVGDFYALDSQTGAQLWTIKAGVFQAGGISIPAMAAAHGLLLVPDGSTLTAFTISNTTE